MSSRGLEKMVRPRLGAGHPEHLSGTPRIRTSGAVARALGTTASDAARSGMPRSPGTMAAR